MDFYEAAIIHWKWPAIDPQQPRKPREPPPGHAFNVYAVTSTEVWEYATTVMALDRAGARALLAHVWFLQRSHSEWDKKVTEAIENDRRNKGSPDNDRRVLYGTQMRLCGSVHSASWPSYIQTVLPRNCGNLRKRGIAA